MKNLHIIHHPIIQDSLTHLRNQETDLQSFRHHSDKMTQLLLVESLRDLALTDREVMTPLVTTIGVNLKDEVVVIPVLRAGIAMLSGAMQLLPKVKVGFVGMQRDEQTAIASEYYWKLPLITEESVVIITDPMLATGGSLLHLLRQIVPKEPMCIKIVCVISAPEGVQALEKEFPDVQIYTAALDERLNEKKYIVPGLGDYGDRYFGTV